ncbi:hypothetical protein LCGC14_0466810 [marine sediment metagenome]|uniref:Uncharacterized protein n=1 Tax=marine sediment metagenome TaxID=412755 RepID=A0A0F9V094_9ZZZZ
MVEIKRKAEILHGFLCPECGYEMTIDRKNNALWCEGQRLDVIPPTPFCPQAGFKFELPRQELILKEGGNPQVTAT